MRAQFVGHVAAAFAVILISGPLARGEVAFEQREGRVDVAIDGRPVTSFHHGPQWPKPFLHPLRSLDGTVVSRGFPLVKVEGESNDHMWHRGLFYAHGDINGVDFWREQTGDEEQDRKLPLPVGRIVCRSPPKTASGVESGTLEVDCDLMAPGGKSLGSLRQTFRFSQRDGQVMIDASFTIAADRGTSLRMGDTEEGSFGMRLADAFRQDRGAILTNSDGLVGTENIWGKRARWVDYSTKIDGRSVGVTLVDHPANPKHPTYWHARGYGLCSANPFGEHDFLGDKSRDGSLTIAEGESLVFRYRAVIHTGNLDSFDAERFARQFATAALPKEANIARWDRFERALASAKPYGDPYRDVTLDVAVTRPDGTVLKTWGFYDGGDTWRFRIMPDQLGKWRYEAKFSDGQPAIKGEFRCVESDLPGLIAADPGGPMWFGYRGGGHELIRGLHVGDRFFAANWPAEKRAAFLDWAAGQGYNTLSIASHYLNRDEPRRGRGWDTPRLWPLDAAEFRAMEQVLDDLARRRLIVFPFAGFFGKSSAYPRKPAEQELYVRYTLARLGPYWNLLWNVAGPEPNVGTGWMEPAEVERLGRLIRRLDPYGHLLSVHNRTGDDPYRDADWTGYGVLQGPKTLERRRLGRGLLENHHSAKPLLAQETLWSGNVNHIRANAQDYTDDDLRKNAIVIHMSAAALVFADNDGDSSSGFSGSMELAERRQDRHDVIRRVWDFFETIPFYRMQPRQDLVDAGFCLARAGEEYLVYLEAGGTVSVKLEPGEYSVEWINARRSEETYNAATTRDGRDLAAPDGGDDWFVHLVRKE